MRLVSRNMLEVAIFSSGRTPGTRRIRHLRRGNSRIAAPIREQIREMRRGPCEATDRYTFLKLLYSPLSHARENRAKVIVS